MRPLGLFGGTFDPIHYGHLRPAEEVLNTLAWDEMRFIPSALPPHRPAPLASAEQRLKMLQLALEEFPRFSVDDREIRRGGISYMVPTLESLRAEMGGRPLSLVLGLDAFLGLESWHRWREIPDLAHLVVLTRPGWVLGDLPAWAEGRRSTEGKSLALTPAGRLFFLSVKPQNISATALRAALARGQSVQGHLPQAVQSFICQNHLYSHLNLRA
jgi:nicotinate-nucleotide adenylyltransferase